MAKMGREAGTDHNRAAYCMDEQTKPLTLQEEKALDKHNYAGGTRGEAGARRANWKHDRATTWHDQQLSDEHINYDGAYKDFPRKNQGYGNK